MKRKIIVGEPSSKEQTQQHVGKILPDGMQRDAIHIAVAPIMARVTLYPGQHVNAKGFPSAPFVGIVDPFLSQPVVPEQYCFIFLYPNTITSLRHEWTHPAFEEEEDDDTKMKPAEARIREIAEALNITYLDLLDAADEWVEYGEYKTQVGSESWRDEFPQYAPEFWALYEVVTNRRVPTGKRESFFSCSC